ncbi:MAG: GNAT family N-acetyltransferase [Saprospiraceae bacterium]|nr:GNAT family N-acetyltransferase [Saprospiraceae bacterium]
MSIILETQRLRIREISLEDLDGLYALDSDPEVHRYLGNNPVTDKKELEDVVRFIQQQYKDFGIGRWAVLDKETGDFLGWSGLKYVTTEINGYSNYYDLGYRFIRKYWGQGIATESALAIISHAFQNMKLDDVYSMVELENAASNKLLLKIGMKYKNTFDYEGVNHNWFSISSLEYKNLN